MLGAKLNCGALGSFVSNLDNRPNRRHTVSSTPRLHDELDLLMRFDFIAGMWYDR